MLCSLSYCMMWCIVECCVLVLQHSSLLCSFSFFVSLYVSVLSSFNNSFEWVMLCFGFVCQFVCLNGWMFLCLLDCLIACFLVCLFACLLVCLVAFFLCLNWFVCLFKLLCFFDWLIVLYWLVEYISYLSKCFILHFVCIVTCMLATCVLLYNVSFPTPPGVSVSQCVYCCFFAFVNRHTIFFQPPVESPCIQHLSGCMPQR